MTSHPELSKDPDTWDARLAQHGGNLLQSWKWGEFKDKHAWQTERVAIETADGLGMAQILFKKRGPVSIGYIPRGPLLTTESPEMAAALFREIDATCKRHRSLWCSIEYDGPTTPESLASLLSSSPIESFQPGATVKIPIVDEASQLALMQQTTRAQIRKAVADGVVVEKAERSDPTAAADFYKLLEDTSGRQQFGVHAEAYYRDFLEMFGDSAALLFAREDGKRVAAVVLAVFGTEAVYMYGASSTELRTRGATRYLQSQATRWAHDRGATSYDLWGIPVEDAIALTSGDKGATVDGLTIFKRGFGGEVTIYAKPMERVYHPFLAQQARRFVRVGS